MNHTQSDYAIRREFPRSEHGKKLNNKLCNIYIVYRIRHKHMCTRFVLRGFFIGGCVLGTYGFSQLYKSKRNQSYVNWFRTPSSISVVNLSYQTNYWRNPVRIAYMVLFNGPVGYSYAKFDTNQIDLIPNDHMAMVIAYAAERNPEKLRTHLETIAKRKYCSVDELNSVVQSIPPEMLSDHIVSVFLTSCKAGSLLYHEEGRKIVLSATNARKCS